MNISVLCAVLFNILCTMKHACAEEMVQKKPPHIVMILADDLGSNDLSYRGSNQFTTPNLDAMGFNGIVLNRHYTEAICTPSRAALLTGKYPIRIGLQGEPITVGEDRHLPDDVKTLPQLLKEKGYTTHLVGKWHLGGARRNDTPTHRGFDTHYGYWHGYVGYFDYELKTAPLPPDSSTVYNGFDLKENFIDAWKDQGRYATTVFTEKALEIIEKQNKNIPMFLMVSHLAVHTGKDGSIEVEDEGAMNSTLGYIEDVGRRRYADALLQLDNSVGQIMEKLQQRNMLQNSVIIFMSDNGAQIKGKFNNAGSNFPLRGEKYSHHDGGIRNAAVLYSPLLQQKNYVHDHLLHITDWLPTLYGLAGGNVSSLNKIDGVDQWQSLSENESSRRRGILINIDEVRLYSGVIGYGGRYKLLNGTVQSGFYDGFSAEPKDSNSVDYDTAAILNSRVNKAIQNTEVDQTPLTVTMINDLRRTSSALRNITKCIKKQECIENCNNLCLFDLWTDPCETENLIADKLMAKIVFRLKYRLSEFWKIVTPQTNKPVDLDSNPSKYNGTWCTWLDDNLCVKTPLIENQSTSNKNYY